MKLRPVFVAGQMRCLPHDARFQSARIRLKLVGYGAELISDLIVLSNEGIRQLLEQFGLFTEVCGSDLHAGCISYLDLRELVTTSRG